MINDFYEIGLTHGATNSAVKVAYIFPAITAITSGGLQFRGNAAWVLAAATKLESLEDLQQGWDSYGGRPLSREARRAAVEAIRLLEKLELPVPGVVLGSGGTVGLEWRRRGKELEVDLGDGSRIEYSLCDKHGNSYEGQSEQNETRLPRLAEWLMSEAEAPIPPIG